MIDVHSHVLPGIDDGAGDLSESLEIARRAASEGVRAMVATPHISDDYEIAIGELDTHVAALNAALADAEIQLTVHRGGEVAAYKLAALEDTELREVSLGGESRYVLVETPYGGVPASFDEALFRLALRGFTAVIAHPERSEAFQQQHERLAALVEQGALLQLTAGAFTGAYGRSARDLSERLVRDGNAHVLGSDVHRAGGSRPGLAAARDELGRSGLGELADWMTLEAPAALLADAELPPRPDAPAARGWLRRRGRAG